MIFGKQKSFFATDLTGWLKWYAEVEFFSEERAIILELQI